MGSLPPAPDGPAAEYERGDIDSESSISSLETDGEYVGTGLRADADFLLGLGPRCEDREEDDSCGEAGSRPEMVCAMTAFAGGETASDPILLKSTADEATEISCGTLGKVKERATGELEKGEGEYGATGTWSSD